MTLLVTASAEPTHGRLIFRGMEYKCVIGAGGVTDAKREGDQCTPLGTWPLQRVFYRPDRVDPPMTPLRLIAIDKSMGWSDDPSDAAHYNRLVSLPYGHGHEALWREDALYDTVVELGYNDDPPVAGRGSAIFIHVARPDYAPTQGCVALSINALHQVLAMIESGETLTVSRANNP